MLLECIILTEITFCVAALIVGHKLYNLTGGHSTIYGRFTFQLVCTVLFFTGVSVLDGAEMFCSTPPFTSSLKAIYMCLAGFTLMLSGIELRYVKNT